jgi:plasmid stabilization system protein ParE
VKPYRFLEEVDTEFHEQIAYFDQQVPGLAERFVADVEATVTDIREYPESGSRLSRKVRKRVLRVFKYNVLYVNESEEIVIVAVAPHKRRPGYWRKRLRTPGG